MPKLVQNLAIAFLGASAVCVLLLCLLGGGIWLALALLFGTAGYHLEVRLLVGRAYDHWMGGPEPAVVPAPALGREAVPRPSGKVLEGSHAHLLPR